MTEQHERRHAGHLSAFRSLGTLRAVDHGMGVERLLGPHQHAEPCSLVREHAEPLRGERGDYDLLIRLIGEAPLVLLGEASHGTHEFYAQRAEITKRLILEKDIAAVAVEGDWPDAFRVNQYVRGLSDDADADAALVGFRRFPQWMWRNTVVREFVEWLRAHNESQPQLRRVGFYGLDLYSLYGSIEAVLEYLEQVDPDAAQRARTRYACFEHFGDDSQAYGYATSAGLAESCEDEAVKQLVDLRRLALDNAHSEGLAAEEQFFSAEQNARLIRSAEAYYRSMFRGRVSSWNLRDRHMAETLEQLLAFLGSRGRRARVAVWAHNSHLGDARATEMGSRRELNVGQLARERYGGGAVLVGFSTYTGSVTAAHDWGAPAEQRWVRPALHDSYEHLFHEAALEQLVLPLRGSAAAEALRAPRLQRAIGVVYRPETERASHYFWTRLADQFDALIHIDETSALEPLERAPEWTTAEVPETFPSGV